MKVESNPEWMPANPHDPSIFSRAHGFFIEDEEYAKLPARLRMNVIGSPGIAKADFELVSLAVSAVNGCGRCVTAHERVLRQHDVSREAVQSAVRIASVIHAVASVLDYETARAA